jgi:hypothetical protein
MIIPNVPNPKAGYGNEKERQQVLDRKGKTAPVITVHFTVSVAHFAWDHDADDQGYWSIAPNQWSVDEKNGEVTSDGLLHTILDRIRSQRRRANLKKWLFPEGDGIEGRTAAGDWSLGHTNPIKPSPRDIAPWDEMKLLSAAIEEGAYEQKVVAGTSQRLVTIWVYWTPEEPPLPPPQAAPPSSVPRPTTSRKPKAAKPESKAPKTESKANPRKRSRPASFGLASDHPVTRLQNSRALQKEEDGKVDAEIERWELESGHASLLSDLPETEDLLNRA